AGPAAVTSLDQASVCLACKVCCRRPPVGARLDDPRERTVAVRFLGALGRRVRVSADGDLTLIRLNAPMGTLGRPVFTDSTRVWKVPLAVLRPEVLFVPCPGTPVAAAPHDVDESSINHHSHVSCRMRFHSFRSSIPCRLEDPTGLFSRTPTF